MQYAKDADGLRVKPTATGQRAECPGCGAEVMSKFGSIIIPHWAHVSSADCDAWYEPITAWHLWWQNQFPEEWREVTITGDNGKQHRADILIPGWGVVEVQHSSISAETIREREQFYKQYAGNICWVVDGRDFMKKRFRDRTLWIDSYQLDLPRNGVNHDIYNDDDFINLSIVKWLKPRKTWWSAEVPVLFDSGKRNAKRYHRRLGAHKDSDIFVWHTDIDAENPALAIRRGRSGLATVLKRTNHRDGTWSKGPTQVDVTTSDWHPGLLMAGHYVSRRSAVNGLRMKAV